MLMSPLSGAVFAREPTGLLCQGTLLYLLYQRSKNNRCDRTRRSVAPCHLSSAPAAPSQNGCETGREDQWKRARSAPQVSGLSPADIVAGAAIAAHPGAYVLGCFDTRITLYSQQVRALELAHALQHEHLLRAGARIAVIGGGAGGATLAAALALQGGTNVRLFEKAKELLPLQSDSHKQDSGRSGLFKAETARTA
jgi:hypothetical protein